MKGCQQHFRSGVTRLARIGGVVPVGQEQRFRRLTARLIEAPDLDTFYDTADTILHDFKSVKPWLQWWMREEHATMLFESQRRMDPILWKSLPSTTNAEEAMHFKIYSAVGRSHTLMEGIFSLLAFVRHYDQLIASVQGEFIHS